MTPISVKDSKKRKLGHYSEHVELLKKACEWAEIPRGRAVTYIKLVEEFFAENLMRSGEHVLAYNESCEIADIYEMWKPHIYKFPGLRAKVKECLLSGPVLQEDENTRSSTNKARNDAFVILLAGKLLNAGINVIAVEEVLALNSSCHTDADISFKWEQEIIDIQCKRPQSGKALVKRAREAIQQINTQERPDQKGIIALDCSSLIRPPGKLMERDSAEMALKDVTDLLQDSIAPMVVNILQPHILFGYLFARVPAMTLLEESPILAITGEPFRTYRPESVSAALILINENFLDTKLLDSISDYMQAHVV